MEPDAIFKQVFKIDGGDYINGGDASCQISNILKEVGIGAETILRVTVAAYEAEMNVVIYADKGTLDFRVYPGKIRMVVADQGPGIADIPRAMEEGFSTATAEVREMGFGAGMGLPNIQRNADVLNVGSEPGRGTRLEIIVNLPENHA